MNDQLNQKTEAKPNLLEIKTEEMAVLTGSIKDSRLIPDIGHCSCQCACDCVCICGDPKKGPDLWEYQGKVPEENKYH